LHEWTAEDKQKIISKIKELNGWVNPVWAHFYTEHDADIFKIWMLANDYICAPAVYDQYFGRWVINPWEEIENENPNA
jgi:starvation-inducible outer membrane lipoprotein